MLDRKQMVIKELMIRGWSFEASEKAVKQIDFAHYIKKYFVTELAELIITHKRNLDYLT